MKISARNTLKGKVKNIIHGPVSTEVVIEVGAGIEIVSVITTHSAQDLALKQGSPVMAVIKASNVLLAVD
ncbi:MAG: TOBE domain-containing protein [Burkholderiales bacterium]